MWMDTVLLSRAASLTLLLLAIYNMFRPIRANGQLHIAIAGKRAAMGKRMAFKEDGIYYIGTVVAGPGDLLLPSGAVYKFPPEGTPPIVCVMWEALEARPDTTMVPPDCHCVKTRTGLVFVSFTAQFGTVLI